nr:retrotransposon ribonuclease H [Tanacetum cinerariifolium]
MLMVMIVAVYFGFGFGLIDAFSVVGSFGTIMYVGLKAMMKNILMLLVLALFDFKFHELEYEAPVVSFSISFCIGILELTRSMRQVMMANRDKAGVCNVGTVQMKFTSGKTVTFHNVLHVPTISKSLEFLLKAYRLLDENSGVIIQSRDVEFFEDKFFKDVENPRASLVPTSTSSSPVEISREINEPMRSTRARKEKSLGSDFFSYLVKGTQMKVTKEVIFSINIDDDPKTFSEAMSSRDAPLWKEAVNDEMDYISARLVEKSYRQREGLDYFDTYAPVARISSIRTLIVISAIKGLYIHQMDVKTTFLNGYLHEEVYMEQPKGFVIQWQENKVCRLVKSLYGLKQALNQWHERFDTTIISFGFQHNSADRAVAQLEYASVIGCLMYATHCTRPNIAFAVSKLSRTNALNLTYTSYPGILEGYSDASWVNHTGDSKSTSGWIYTLAGGAVSWASMKQTCISHSTMKAEFIALAATGKEVGWMRDLLLDIQLWPDPIPSILMYCDSQATLSKAYNFVYNGKSRHIRLQHNYVRQVIENGTISVVYVKSCRNLADPLTKPLTRDLGQPVVGSKKNPLRFILTWEDLVSKFINKFFPPSRTTNLRNEISNFQQRFDESFHEAWDRYKDLLRACPHHGFTELHQLDTFYNALNPIDQDSLNSAAGGNLLERRTQDVLTIIKNKSKVRNSRNKSIVSQVKSSDANSSSSSEIAKLTHAVNQQTSAVTTAMTAILKQFQATPLPASVKAVEEICVTCGGAHPYYQCLDADGNTFPELRDNIQGYVSAAAVNYNQGNSGYHPPGVANQIRPPGFAQPNVKNNQNRFSQPQGYNRGNNFNQDQAYQAPIQQNQVVPLRPFPRNTIANPKGELKAIITRSGIVLDGPSIPIPPPFINPKEDERVEETLTDLELVILKKLPKKLGDPGKFLIPCGFNELKCKALADLGASINLMPLSVWKKLGLPELISTRMTLELANRAICTPAGIARDVFVPVGKFTFPADFVIVDYESEPRVPLILGRHFLRTARALIDVHGEEMILRDDDERLTSNMRHDTSSYSNQPQKESINMINIYDDSCEDFLKDLFATNHLSGNPTFSSHSNLTSSKVKDDIFDPEGDMEFADELALITFPPRNDDLSFDIDSDLKEMEYLLNHDPIKEMESILEDSIDESNLADLNDNLVDTMPEMFTDEHALDYSSPPLYDEYDDDLFEVKSDTEYVYDDPFDSNEKKIKESKLLIDELDLPRLSDFLPSLEYDSFLFEDFFEVDALSSTNNEDKVFNPGILIQENLFEVNTRVAPDKNVKKIAISHASLILKDFDPPLYELSFHKEVPWPETLLLFSSKNKEKVFKPGILTSKRVHNSLLPVLSHQGLKSFKFIKILESPMEIFSFYFGEDIRILDVSCLHFYPP